MEIGTIETIEPPKKRRKRRSGFSGSGGNKNNGGNGGGGDDNDGPGPHDTYDSPRSASTIPRILTAFLLLIVMMTFGGLISAYIVLATNGVAEWRPFALPIQVWISTAIIIASSLVYHIAKKAFDDNEQEKAKKWLLATTVLGAAFISSQILVWLELSQMGVYVAGNPYAGFFYILTGVHAVHVLGGVIALGSIVLRSWHETVYEPEIKRRTQLAQVVGWYWHFMGGLWIVLFILLGFWK
jgi:cytochrome c oxidase subunit 3